MPNIPIDEHREPQSIGAIVRDSAGNIVGIWTEDGHFVLMTAELARKMARQILDKSGETPPEPRQ